MNDRIDNINKIIDEFVNYDKINDLIKEFKNELEYYEYIDTVDNFSLLSLKGSMKYINKYDKKIRTGGLLIKIYKNDNNHWFGIIKKINGKRYHISFNNNYIFYLKTKDELFKKSLECFLSNYNS
jgi:hypothetical protein